MKKLLQLLLALTMARPAAFAEKNKTFNYVSFGDSQAAGLGLHGCVPEWFYEDPSYYWVGENPMTGESTKNGFFCSGYYFQSEQSYPKLIEKELKKEYKNVNFTPCTVNGVRAGSIEALINKKELTHVYEMFMTSMYVGGCEQERHETYTINGNVYTYDKEKTNIGDEMVKAITNADLITYDLGANDFGGFLMFGGFAPYLEEFGIKFSDLHDVIPSEYADIYYSVKGYLLEKVLAFAGDDISPDMLSSLVTYVDVFVYALLAYITSFDATLGKIYELNPDVEVVVMSIQNIYKGSQARFSEDLVIPLGDIIGILLQVANAYTAYFSPYANKYNYVDFGNDHVEDHFSELTRWASHRSPFNNSVSRYRELNELINDMPDLIDAFNVYSELMIKYNIEQELAERENIVVAGKQLTYSEIMSSNNSLLRSVQKKLKTELAVKSKLAYYGYARTFVNAMKNPVMSMETTWGESEEWLSIGTIVKSFQDKFNPNLSEEANILSLINDLDKTIDAEFGGEKNLAKAEKIYAELLGTGFATAFMPHRAVTGHEECAKRALAAFHAKNKNRTTGKQGLLAALPSILINFDKEKSYQTVVDVFMRVTPFIVGGTLNEHYIVTTIDELIAFLDNANALISENEETVDTIKTAVAELVEQLGLTEKFNELMSSNPLLKEFLDNPEAILSTVFGDAKIALKVLEFIEILRNTFIGRDITVAVSYAVGNVLKNLGIVLAEMTSVLKDVTEKVGEAVLNTPNVISYTVKAVEEVTSKVAEKVMEVLSYAGHVISKLGKATVEATVNTLEAIADTMAWADNQIKNLASFIATQIHNGLVATGEVAKATAIAFYNAVKFTVNRVDQAFDFVLDQLAKIPGLIGKGISNVRGVILSVLSWTDSQVKKAVNAIAEVLSNIPAAIHSANEFVVSSVRKLMHLAQEGIEELVTFERNVAHFVASEISEAMPYVSNFVEGAAKFVADSVKGYVEFMKDFIPQIPGLIRDAARNVYEISVDLLKEGYEFAKTAFTTTVKLAVEFATNVTEYARKVAQNLPQAITEAISVVRKALQDGAKYVLETVSSVAREVEGFIASILARLNQGPTQKRSSKGAPKPTNNVSSLIELIEKIKEGYTHAEDVTTETIVMIIEYAAEVIPAVIRTVYDDLVSSVNAFFDNAVSLIKNALEIAVNTAIIGPATLIMGYVNEMIKAFEGAFSAWSPVIDSVGKRSKTPAKANPVSELVELIQKIRTALGIAEDVTTENLVMVVEYVAIVIPEAVKTIYGDLVSAVNNFVATVYSSIKDALETAVNASIVVPATLIMGYVNEMIEAFKGAFNAWSPIF